MYLRKVHSAYLGCQQRQGVIGPWDFQQMGQPLPRAAACITTAEVWPRFPDSDYEFWLYAARTVKQFGGQIPEFMFPVTDLTAVDALMAKWLRIQSVRNWKQTLENLEIDGGADIPGRDLELDLRVCIDRHEVRLQWRLEDKGEFEELKASHVRQIQSEYDAGRVRMPVPAELLWR